jgi:phosphoribosyl-ATP pyrophosphohydrolase/phosphoribosyl-AMP cyclohydrolase
VCHLGTDTCFGNESALHGPPAQPALDVSDTHPLAFLSTLEAIIDQRVTERPEGSYTARLLAQGPKRVAQKVGEEGVEVALAAVTEADDKVVAESADLLYHLLVLLKSRGLQLAQVIAELESRHAG